MILDMEAVVKRSLTFGLVVSLTYLASGSIASACLSTVPVDYGFLRHADVVMRAEILAYQPEPNRDSARLQLRPTEVLTRRGKTVPLWHARWFYSSYKVPETWKGSKDVVVALRAVLTRDGSAEVQVVQQPCGPMSILEFSTSTYGKVKAVLATSGMRADEEQ